MKNKQTISMVFWCTLILMQSCSSLSSTPSPTDADIKDAIEKKMSSDDKQYYRLESVQTLGKTCQGTSCTVQIKCNFITIKRCGYCIPLPSDFVKKTGQFNPGERFSQENTLELIYFPDTKIWRTK